MERGSLKEYSEAAIVEKEELYAMKSCFKELHTFLLMRGEISSLEVKTQEAEFYSLFQAFRLWGAAKRGARR